MTIYNFDDLKEFVTDEENALFVINDECIQAGTICQRCGDVKMRGKKHTFDLEFMSNNSEDDIASFIDSETGKDVFYEDDINLCDCKEDNYDYDDDDYFYEDNEDEEYPYSNEEYDD